MKHADRVSHILDLIDAALDDEPNEPLQRAAERAKATIRRREAPNLQPWLASSTQSLSSRSSESSEESSSGISEGEPARGSR